jgi:hypothetical protein
MNMSGSRALNKAFSTAKSLWLSVLFIMLPQVCHADPLYQKIKQIHVLSMAARIDSIKTSKHLKSKLHQTIDFTMNKTHITWTADNPKKSYVYNLDSRTILIDTAIMPDDKSKGLTALFDMLAQITAGQWTQVENFFKVTERPQSIDLVALNQGLPLKEIEIFYDAQLRPERMLIITSSDESELKFQIRDYQVTEKKP